MDTDSKNAIPAENSALIDWKKKTALFMSGQAVSLFGSSLVQFAIIWHITLTTRSGPMMTLSSLAAFLPQILISLFAGVWADRYNRRFLILAADILISTSTLILAILFLTGYGELWLLFVVTAIRSLGAGIQTPAVAAFIPQIVPQEMLPKVNGINGSIQAAIMLLSPAASGALLSLASLEAIFFIDVGTALVAILIMLSLKVPPHAKAAGEQKGSQLDDLKEGFRYANGQAFVKSLLLFYSVFFILVTPVAFLTPLMIARSFGDEVWRLTANEMAFFAGSILGGAVFTVWSGFKNRIYTLALSCVLFGVLNIALGLAGNFYLYLVFMAICGMGMPFFSTPVTVMLQEKVHPDMLGRIFSMIQIVSATALPLGMLLFGPMAEVVRVEDLLIGTGVLMALAGASITYNKGLKSAT